MTPKLTNYDSRTSREPAIMSRLSPTVHPDGADVRDGLTPAQLAAYDRDGFVVLPQVFTADETATLRHAVEALAADPKTALRAEAVCEPQSAIVRSIFKVHAIDPVIAQLARDPKLVAIARQIVGSDVYIHQSRANLKPGFHGKEFYWHSDFETWHIEDGMPEMRAVSCSVLLTDNNEFNGPLMLIPGSHRYFIACVGETPSEHYKHSLRKQEYGVPDPVSLDFLAERGGMVSATGQAGSVVFFDCNVMHGSNSNISPYPRSNVFMVYNSVHNTLGDPKKGLAPRPEFIATRDDFTALQPVAKDWLTAATLRPM